MQNPATYREIVSQPAAWDGALQAVNRQATSLRSAWEAQPVEQVVFAGCGSTYYLSLAAAMVFQSLTGTPARGIPAGEFSLVSELDHLVGSGPTLLVAVSRSGTTTETLRAVERFRQADKGRVLTVGCYPDSDLARLGDANVTIPEGREESVAQTRSFAAMYVACCALAATLAGMEDVLAEMSCLPETGGRLIADTGERMRALADPGRFDRIYFLGSGLRYGLASECSLKMKEMSLTHAEPFHFLEFRHGPISMVTDSTLVVGLLSEDPQGREAAVLRDVLELGGHVLPLGETPLPGFESDRVSFESGLGEVARSVLYLPPLQLLGLERALAKGLNPDRPRNLQPVVYLDD